MYGAHICYSQGGYGAHIYYVQSGKLCLYSVFMSHSYVCVVFMLLQAGYLSLYGVCTVTARTVMSVLCSYLLQPQRLCLYVILQEGWACN